MNTFVPFNEWPLIEQLACTYSDAHKDAYGFRPRNGGIHNPQTVEEYEAAIEKCAATIDEQETEECRRSLAAQRELEADLARLISIGAPDRATALRWWIEGLGAEPIWFERPRYYTQDIESAVYGVLPMKLWEFVLPEIIPGYRSF